MVLSSASFTAYREIFFDFWTHCACVTRYHFGGPGVDIFIFFRTTMPLIICCCHAGECVLKAYKSAQAHVKNNAFVHGVKAPCVLRAYDVCHA